MPKLSAGDQMTYVLGLTGGIASGKSTVAKILSENGAEIIDADQIARQVVVPGTIGLKQITQVFGTKILTTTGQLNRKKLGEIVFSNPDDLKKLTAITAPLIRRELKLQLAKLQQQQVKLVVLMIPLLFETGYQTWCDETLSVTLPLKLQLQRLQQRDQLTTAAAQARIATQMSGKKRDQLADTVIDNSQGIGALEKQVIKWLQERNLT